VPVSSTANQFDVVFNNGAGMWDNNNGQDWHFNVSGAQAPAFVMDGELDASASQVAANGSRQLYAAMNGDVLYVATQDAGEGSDVFIYVADTPGSLVAANWAKAGQIAQWDAFLADENNNDFENWFDAVAGAAQAATAGNGGVLEGTLNLAMEFGALPSAVYLAVGVYATNDGGALISSQQVPASVNGNGNIDAVEWFLLQIAATPGDYNRDGDVDDDDFIVWLEKFGTNDPSADGNKNGVVDNGDYVVWRKFYGSSGAGGFTLTRIEEASAFVPEPSVAALLALAVGILALRRQP
jgi:hypothetical protein